MYLYRLFNLGLYGGKNETAILECLQQKAVEYNKLQKENSGGISFEFDSAREDNDFSLAIVIKTPLMSRVHKHVKHSSELVFMHITSSVDEEGSQFFLLCTHLAAGGLRLAGFLTNNESEKTLTMALELVKKNLPVEAFFGRGIEAGPHILLTDNNNEEHSSLHTVWPSAVLLLCLFHVMEAIWHWLYDKKNGNRENHRQEIIKLVKEIVHAETEEDNEDKYAEMVEVVNEMGDCGNFPDYFDHFVGFIERAFARHTLVNCQYEGTPHKTMWNLSFEF